MNSMRQTLYFNGIVLTMNEYRSEAEAVLTEGGHIVQVGNFEEVAWQAKPGCARRDLRGCAMVPGFIDPHGHFPDSGIMSLFKVDLAPPPLGDCRSLAMALERLSSQAEATPEGEWVLGAMFDPAGVPERRFPTRDELDEVSGTHPVWTEHFTGHAGVANSLALAWRGVDESSPDPDGGRLGRDHPGGRLTGLLEGMSAMGALGDTEFGIGPAEFRKAAANAGREYLSKGVTMAQNSWAPKTLLRYFVDLAENPLPTMPDLVVLPAGHLEPELSENRLDFALLESASVRFGPRKLFADGSLHVQTACLTEPYFKPLNGDAGHRCEPSISAEGMFKQILPLHEAGFQVHIHVNGDATADIVLDAFDRVLDAVPRSDHRHTLIHAQTVRKDQLDRMAQLGVSASFFPAHIYYWGEYHREVSLGPARAENISPARWAVESGVRFTIHNDATVTPTLPLHLAWCAAERKTNRGRVLGEDQRLTPLEALKAHMIDAAWQVFAEAERGSIEVGKRADFAILSGNPLDAGDGLKDLRVLETVLAGESVYRE